MPDVSIFLPPCHEDADKPENVYRFDDRILYRAEPCFTQLKTLKLKERFRLG